MVMFENTVYINSILLRFGRLSCFDKGKARKIAARNPPALDIGKFSIQLRSHKHDKYDKHHIFNTN
jgi:hypothetical protein